TTSWGAWRTASPEKFTPRSRSGFARTMDDNRPLLLAPADHVDDLENVTFLKKLRAKAVSTDNLAIVLHRNQLRIYLKLLEKLEQTARRDHFSWLSIYL